MRVRTRTGSTGGAGVPLGRKPRKRHVAPVAISFSLIAGLTACGGAAKQTGSPAATNSAGGAPVSGGTLNIAIAADVATLDWGFSTAAITREVGWNIFETPFAADANYEIRPMLASSYTRSADGLTYTIPLRGGVHFQNGATMTATDVVASIKRWMAISGTGKLAAQHIASVTATDPLTVTIKMTKPFDLPAAMSGANQACIVIPAATAEAAMNRPLKNSELVGTGPYEFKSQVPGQSITLTRFSDYSALPKTDSWGGDAGYKAGYIQTLNYQVTTDPSIRESGLQTGQFGFATQLTTSDYSQMTGSTTVEPVLLSGADQALVLMNPMKAPFNNTEMRQALNYATNKAELAAAADGQPRFYQLDPSIYLPAQKLLHSDTGSATYKDQNLQKAKQLVAESGYDTSNPIVLQTSKDYPQLYRATVALAQEIDAIGLKAKVVANDSAAMFAAVDNPKDWDIWFISFVPYFAPDLELFLQPGYLNHFQSPTLTALFDAYDKASTPNAQRTAAIAIQQFVWKEVPVIKVMNEVTLEGRASKLHNFVPFFNDVFWNSWLAK